MLLYQWRKWGERFGNVKVQNRLALMVLTSTLSRERGKSLKVTFFNSIKLFEATGSLSRGCNPSFIALVAKCSDPIDISDFRPISLIGCLYKICYASSLCYFRNHPTQQIGFIFGRQILDGILLANEIISYAKKMA